MKRALPVQLPVQLLALLLVTSCSAVSSGSTGIMPNGVLSEDGFWALVDKAATGAVLDRAYVLAQELHGKGPHDLEGYQQVFVQVQQQLYTYDVDAALTLICGPLDPDGLSDARSWIVAQGKAVYGQVLASPDALAGVPDLKDVCSGSGNAFGSAAVALYSDAGYEPGSEAFPEPDPEGVPAGTRPSPSQLRTLLPKLTARFG